MRRSRILDGPKHELAVAAPRLVAQVSAVLDFGGVLSGRLLTPEEMHAALNSPITSGQPGACNQASIK